MALPFHDGRGRWRLRPHGIAKRPVWLLNMGHTARQNGPFCIAKRPILPTTWHTTSYANKGQPRGILQKMPPITTTNAVVQAQEQAFAEA